MKMKIFTIENGKVTEGGGVENEKSHNGSRIPRRAQKTWRKLLTNVDKNQSNGFDMIRINFYSLKLVKEDITLYETAVIKSPVEIYQAAKQLLALHEKPEEHFCIFCLNTKNKIIGVHTISIGSLDASIVHPREVFKAAMLNNASAIICLHNHPTGDPEPSWEDIETTKRLVEAGEIMGIEVIDHIIIGDENNYISFKCDGLM